MLIAIGVDGVLAKPNDGGWTPGETYGGAQEFLREIANRGHEIVIMDPRASDVTQAQNLWKWLVENELDFNDVWVLQGTPKADLIILGNAPGFKRNYVELLKYV